MAQAVLILAHKNIEQVHDLANILSSAFNVYIHVDTKTKLTSEQQTNLKKIDHCQVIQARDVKWGSYSIVQATLDLMNLAMKNPSNQYFHLISGQDWPLKSPREIYQYFEHSDKLNMVYWRMLDKIKTGEQEIDWVKYWYNYDQINRRSFFGKVYHRMLLITEKLMGVNRLKKLNLDEDQMYAGREWVDVPRDILEFALAEYQKRTDLQTLFKNSFCSDEMWLQTIVCNSKYRDRIDQNIHRYLPEAAGKTHGIKPQVITAADYSEIASGDYFFGRKFVMPESDEIIHRLTKDGVHS